VSTVVPPPSWPADPGHREAIDTLLVMAEAEDRWGDPRRAVDLLDNVERIIGTLPRGYDEMRVSARARLDEDGWSRRPGGWRPGALSA
jgi:hypothetical protein